MATITVRALNTANGAWEPAWGQGLSNFISDLEAVTQLIQQTLLLLYGEWFENVRIGTPLFQAILGVPNTSAGVALVIRQRIVSVPYVTDVQDLDVTYSGSSRAYSLSATVITQFGSVQIATQPLPGLQANLPS